MKEEVHRGALVNDTTVYAALAIIMIRIHGPVYLHVIQKRGFFFSNGVHASESESARKTRIPMLIDTLTYFQVLV